jgi:phosphoglycolate phosphatase
VTETAAQLVASAKAILLDFDGPVTRLMPWPQNARAADSARRPLLLAGFELPEDVAGSTDHLAVLRYAPRLGAELLGAVEDACIRAEVAAAEVSQPTPGAHDFLAACQREEKPVVIVSNNAADAVHAYLLRFQLHGLVRGVVGRQLHRPDLMKPHPSLLGAALDLVTCQPPNCVMIGDSTTDIQAARNAGMPSIGYAKTETRGVQLRRAGSTAVIANLSDLHRTAQP